MRILLDSHVALWWLAGSERLGSECRSTIATAGEAYLSAVTPWELGIKRSLGKLDLPDGLVEALVAGGFATLAITTDHALHAPQLPPHHEDPFDRMLIAQAQLESLTLVSADDTLRAYDEVVLLDARR